MRWKHDVETNTFISSGLIPSEDTNASGTKFLCHVNRKIPENDEQLRLRYIPSKIGNNFEQKIIHCA